MCIFRRNRRGKTEELSKEKDKTIETLRDLLRERNEQLRKANDRNGKLQYKLDYLKKFVEDHGLEVPKEATNLRQRRIPLDGTHGNGRTTAGRELGD
jgi:hypothetical protein